MNFWNKYGRYVKMLIYVAIYYVLMFTNASRLVMLPFENILGIGKVGSAAYSIIGNVLIYSIIFCVSLFLIPDIYYLDFMIFKKKPIGKKLAEIGIGYGIVLGANLIGSLFTIIGGGGIDSANESSIGAMLSSYGAWAAYPVIVVIGPIVEETVFRGVLQGTIIGSKFEKPNSPRVFAGIIIPAILFGLIHVIDAGDYIQVIPYIFMGIGLGTVAYFSKGIGTSSIVHILNNLIATAAAIAIWMLVC